MRIAAVVVTHNRPRLLHQVIDALHAQTRAVNALFVIDNASGAETQALLCNMRDVTALRSDVNLGGTGGFRLGMERALTGGFDWIWLLDDDAIPRPVALQVLEQSLARLPSSTGAVCGMVREFGDIALVHRRRFTAMLGLERSIARSSYQGSAVQIDTGSFVGFMVSATAIAAIGLPDPAFFLAYDDTEYSLRLKRHGFSLWLVPGSIVDHMRVPAGRLRATVFERRHYFNIRNRIIVRKEYAGHRRLAGWLGCLVGIAIWLRSQGSFQGRTLRILLQALADGWHARMGGYPTSLIRLD